MRWDRETLDAQDPADIDDLCAVLTARRISVALDRALVYAQAGEAEAAKMDLALYPDILEEFARGG
jgi:hypothetical protein